MLTQTYAHIQIITHMHTHINTYTHAHTYKYTCMCTRVSCVCAMPRADSGSGCPCPHPAAPTSCYPGPPRCPSPGAERGALEPQRCWPRRAGQFPQAGGRGAGCRPWPWAWRRGGGDRGDAGQGPGHRLAPKLASCPSLRAPVGRAELSSRLCCWAPAWDWRALTWAEDWEPAWTLG